MAVYNVPTLTALALACLNSKERAKPLAQEYLYDIYRPAPDPLPLPPDASRFEETVRAEVAISRAAAEERYYEASRRYKIGTFGEVPCGEREEWYCWGDWVGTMSPFRKFHIPCTVKANGLVLTRFKRLSRRNFSCRFEYNAFRFRDGQKLRNIWYHLRYSQGVYSVAGSFLPDRRLKPTCCTSGHHRLEVDFEGCRLYFLIDKKLLK